ncbi:hypothetical protein ONA70_02930 [Micromonospora yasonensis]|uniref:hypothetical protein n=1 Tax=Micromonospora yasonensis TaxID=1128667 RepID=UPI0022312DBB|nr:hypothetical protein [Micromonospora yasonensis]MCW3839049.1 hypothetical protein [Micromonospora yasonensis]
MNAHRMDQETVERLLVGPVAHAPDGPEVLVQLLAAVRAAPRPHELSGEAAALQAFRLARAGSAPVLAARPGRRFLAGLLGAKVALAALVAAATGGVALAAVTGTMPGPLGRDPATTPGTSTTSGPAPTSGPSASGTPGANRTDAPGGTPALAGLCIAYRSEPDESRRQALESPRFAELVTAAGGREKVASYCNRLLDRPGKPSGSTGGETKRPDAEPSGRVTGKPERTPAPAVTVTPTSQPSGPAGPAGNQPASIGPTRH